MRDLRKHLRGFDDAGVVVGMHVDKAGRQAESFGFYGLLRGAVERMADLNDAAVAQSNVALLRVVAAAVEHICIADECVAIQHFG